MRATLLVLLCTSCALPGLLGYDAQQREDLARRSHEAAETIKKAVVECAPDVVEKVTEAAEAVQTNTADQVSRAKIVQKLYGVKPQELPEPRSPADDAKVNALAGKAEDKETRRRIAKELPGKMLGGAASVVRDMIPRWLLWTTGAGIFVACGGLSFVIIVWRRARQGLREMIRLANRPEVKEHFKNKTNGPVQRQYRYMREKGLL